MTAIKGKNIKLVTMVIIIHHSVMFDILRAPLKFWLRQRERVEYPVRIGTMPIGLQQIRVMRIDQAK